MFSIKTESAGGVILNSKGQVLVVNQHGSSWSLPKGHVEGDELLLEAAKREIKEETGITDLEFIRELGSYTRYRIGLHAEEDESELKHITFFLFMTTQMDLKPEDQENPEAKWIEPNQVADLLTHPKDSDFFNRILTQLSQLQ